MATVSFSVEKFGPANAVRGDLVTSGTHTSSGAASNLTDGAAGAGSAVTFETGDVVTIFADASIRLKQGGETVAASDGHIIAANVPTNLYVYATGTIGVIDSA